MADNLDDSFDFKIKHNEKSIEDTVNKKTKKKRKNITEEIELNSKELSDPDNQINEFQCIVNHFHNSLSSVEKKDYNLSKEKTKMLVLKKSLSLSKEPLHVQFNKKFNLKINKISKKKNYEHSKKKSAVLKPFIIILCSSASRCIQFQKELSQNNKYLKKGKISWYFAFAKHKNLNEQISYLKNIKSKKSSINASILFGTPSLFLINFI